MLVELFLHLLQFCSLPGATSNTCQLAFWLLPFRETQPSVATLKRCVTVRRTRSLQLYKCLERKCIGSTGRGGRGSAQRVLKPVGRQGEGAAVS